VHIGMDSKIKDLRVPFTRCLFVDDNILMGEAPATEVSVIL